MAPPPQDNTNGKNSIAVNLQDAESKAAVTKMVQQLAMETDTTASNIQYDFSSDDDREISNSSCSSDNDDVDIGMSRFSVKRERSSWSANIPPDGTPLYEYLNTVKQRIANKTHHKSRSML